MSETPVPMLELTSPIAKELTEYILLQHDIKASHASLTVWFKRFCGPSDEKEPDDAVIGASVFRDSIIMFMGCFDRSAPLFLDEAEVYKTTLGGAEYFQWLRDMRDAYAAHKFGALRQCAVGVLLDGNGDVLGIGQFSSIYLGPAKEAEGQMLQFIAIAGNYVAAKIKELEARLKQEANDMTREERAKLKTARLHGVDPANVRTSRPAFQRKMRESRTDP